MKRERCTEIKLSQPYMPFRTNEFQKIVVKKYGISHFYEFNKQEENKKQLQAVPDGSVDLLFGIEKNQVHTYIGGTVLKAKEWPLYDGITYFGVSFEPGEYLLPHDLSIEDVIDDDIKISDISLYTHLETEIAESPEMKTRCQVFLKDYISMIQKMQDERKENSLEVYIRNRIYACKGNVSIKMLSEETGYSECYIRRVFKEVHGISPKVFEKFVRFQYLLSRLEEKMNVDRMDEIALACGYYDQSHMVKDFKRFSGMTPEIYLKMISSQNK